MCTYVGLPPQSKSISTPLKENDSVDGRGGERKMKDVSKFSNESIRKFWSKKKKSFVIWMRDEIYRDEHKWEEDE